MACPYSSSTIAPAPSPSTKPSRSLSQGRLAPAGSSLRVESARAEAKPPIASSVTVASAPPATITSASPRRIDLPASPMQCVEVVHAVTIAMFGPLAPSRIERLPAIMLMIVPGMKNGEMRRGPFFLSSSCIASMSGKPPMPEPKLTPMRSAFSGVTASPESRHACTPAAMP